MWQWSGRFLITSILLFALSGCGGNASQLGAEVAMLDNTFVPETLAADVGTTITFINKGRAPHNVIGNDGRFDSRRETGKNHESGESWSLTVDEAGTYPYYCSLHAVQQDDGSWTGMVGTLVVTEPTGS